MTPSGSLYVSFPPEKEALGAGVQGGQGRVQGGARLCP